MRVENCGVAPAAPGRAGPTARDDGPWILRPTSADPLWAEPLSDREQVVVQVMAAITQGGASAEPDDQLGSNPAGHRRQHRPGYGVHVGQKASQFHLAGVPGPLPAGQLRLDALPHDPGRAAVHHSHVSHRRPRPHPVATSRCPGKVSAPSGMSGRCRGCASGQWADTQRPPIPGGEVLDPTERAGAHSSQFGTYAAWTAGLLAALAVRPVPLHLRNIPRSVNKEPPSGVYPVQAARRCRGSVATLRPDDAGRRFWVIGLAGVLAGRPAGGVPQVAGSWAVLVRGKW